MERNNTVYLLVGQRGSGKSYYAKRILESQLGLSAVSRDQILMRLFSSVHTNPYTGGQYIAQKIMSRLLRRKLSTQTGLKLILDSWTAESSERQSLVKKLREYGATRVVALYFVTPVEEVTSWFFQKPGIARIEEMRTRQEENLTFFSKDAPMYDHQTFHRLASQIDSDGFDEVIRINPLEKLVILS